MHWRRVVGAAAIIALVSSPQAQEAPRSRASQLLYMQADQLTYDTRGNRVVAQGTVEIYYNNYIVTADQVIYDGGANTLVVDGNAQLRAPDGQVTRADRLEMSDEFRDAFVRSLGTTIPDGADLPNAPR